MPNVIQKYPLEEYSRRGQEIFERKIAPLVTNEPRLSFVAIDIDSEDFVVDADEHRATNLLRERHPEAQIYMRRVGTTYTHIIGGRPRTPGRIRRLEKRP